MEDKMPEHILQFIKHLTVIRNLPEATTTSYKTDLLQFNDFLSKARLDFNKQSIRAFLSYLVDKKYSTQSIAKKMTVLRTFSKYLLNKNIIQESPVHNISSPKLKKKLPVYLNKIEMNNLLSLPDITKSDGRRDLLILKFFYATGLRVSELVNLKYSQIDLKNNVIRILGKRKKTRLVPLGQKLIAEIKEYSKHTGTDYIFVNNKGKPYTRQHIHKIVKSYIEQVACAKNAHPHVLRHTFATHLLNEGASLLAVKELLGHASLSTTQIYTHVSTTHLKRIYNQAHPRANL